jgi:hypothetical protein
MLLHGGCGFPGMQAPRARRTSSCMMCSASAKQAGA